MRRIYVASSWRNTIQPYLVRALRNYGHEVYDFRNPPDGGDGFHWSEIDLAWESWSVEEYVAALREPIAQRGFANDKAGMDWADTCVLLLPCGKSAHLEAGYMAGQGKLVIPAFLEEKTEPELMYLLLGTPAIGMTALLVRLENPVGAI